MTKIYTIKGKEYSEFDIKRKCAEIMYKGTNCEVKPWGNTVFIDNSMPVSIRSYDPLINPCDTWPIIEKVWDELTNVACLSTGNLEWHQLVLKHNCSKLIAACICYIEVNHEQ